MPFRGEPQDTGDVMKGNGSITTRGKGGKIFFWVMMALPILQFVIFYIGVNFNNVLLAFKAYDKNTAVWDFPNYTAFTTIWASKKMLWGYVKNSLQFFLANAVITMPLTLIFAYYVFRKFFMAGFFKVLLFLPSVICCMVLLIFYQYFVDSVLVTYLGKVKDKTIDPILSSFIKSGHEWKMWCALMFFSIVVGFSGSILLYLNAMSQISVSVLEAAKIDGAGEMRSFISVVIPGVWGTIVSLFCVSLAGMLTNQAYLFSLFGNDARDFIRTMGYYMYVTINPDTPDYSQYPYVAAIGLVLTCVIAPLTIGLRKLMVTYGPSED